MLRLHLSLKPVQYMLYKDQSEAIEQVIPKHNGQSNLLKFNLNNKKLEKSFFLCHISSSMSCIYAERRPNILSTLNKAGNAYQLEYKLNAEYL